MKEDKQYLDKVKWFIYEYHKKENKLPSVKQVAQEIGLSEYKVVEMFRILEHMGFLRRNNTRYKMKDPEKVESSPEELNTLPTPPDEALKKDLFGSAVFVVIRVIMLIIGVVALSISWRYTYVWFDEFLNKFWASVFSGVMVGFSAMAFEIIIILMGHRRYVLGALFIFLWVIVLAFSMVSTIAGQYNQRVENEEITLNENIGINYRKAQLEIYNNTESDLKVQLEEKRTQRDSLQVILSEIDTLEERENSTTGWVFHDTNEKMKEVDGTIEKLLADIQSIRDKKLSLLDGETQAGLIELTETKSPSFYIWIGGIFGVESRFIEFWLSIFPAIFIDLIAPFSLAVSLFLSRNGLQINKNKNKKSKKDKEDTNAIS